MPALVLALTHPNLDTQLCSCYALNCDEKEAPAGKGTPMTCVIALMADGTQIVIEKVRRVEVSGMWVLVFIDNCVEPMAVEQPIKVEIV